MKNEAIERAIDRMLEADNGERSQEPEDRRRMVVQNRQRRMSVTPSADRQDDGPSGTFGDDQLWVVVRPTKDSEMLDVCFQATVRDLMLQSRGGLDPKDVLGLYKPGDQQKAVEFAERLMRMVARGTTSARVI